MSAEESKRQIGWVECDLAIILTALLWQCLRSASATAG
jgi:hypothetical protein